MHYSACYRVLGLKPGAAPEQVHSAYKQLALRYHPDRTADDPSSRAMFCRISEAYATLKNAFHLRAAARRAGECRRCLQLGELFTGLDGRSYCASCLLPDRRRLLPLPKFETIRCVGAISLLLAAFYCIVAMLASGIWHHGAAAAALSLAGLAALGYDVRRADVICR